MPKFKVQHIQSPYPVEVKPYTKSYPKQIQREIESNWNVELLQRGNALFNGKILSLIEFNMMKLIGEFVDYKVFLAQVRNPQLKEELEITPVCVSGVIICENALLFGRRSIMVTQDPGKWECPPSGAIDDHFFSNGQIDIHLQLFQELHEETGLAEVDINQSSFFAVVHDQEKNIVDIAARIDLYPSSMKKVPPSTEEYSELKWIPLSELTNFITDNQHEIIPLSLYLIQESGGLGNTDGHR